MFCIPSYVHGPKSNLAQTAVLNKNQIQRESEDWGMGEFVLWKNGFQMYYWSNPIPRNTIFWQIY